MKGKKNILIISDKVPFPLQGGGHIAQYAVLEELQHYMHITLCMPVRTDAQLAGTKELAARLTHVKIEVIDVRQGNAPALTPSFPRRVLNLFSGKQNDTPRAQDDFDHPKKLQALQVRPYAFCRQLLALLDKQKFDIIQLEFFELLDLVHLLPADVPKVFVHHELRYRVLEGSSRASEKDERYKEYVVRTIRAVELDLLNRFDGIITFSEEDKKALGPHLRTRIEAIPFPVRESEFDRTSRPARFRKLVFLGGENHYPNYEGLRWYLENCFAAAWERFKLPIYVIGNWTGPTIQRLAQKDKVIFTGFLEDYRELVKDAIMIVPVRIGSGIRAKTLYAMANRVPVISTTVGVEGIGREEDGCYIVADNEAGFTEGIGKLLDEKFASGMLDRAIALTHERFSQEKIRNDRVRFYDELINLKK